MSIVTSHNIVSAIGMEAKIIELKGSPPILSLFIPTFSGATYEQVNISGTSFRSLQFLKKIADLINSLHEPKEEKNV